MDKSRLMIVMGKREWTLNALHLACAMSRRGEADIWLLKMIPVRHPLLLGTKSGSLDFSQADAQAIVEAAATVEDYDVPLQFRLFQYASYWSGVVDAAAQLNVTAVIVHVPPSPLPYWEAWRRWWLNYRLVRQQQQFLTLDDLKPSLVWAPSITLQKGGKHLLESQ